MPINVAIPRSPLSVGGRTLSGFDAGGVAGSPGSLSARLLPVPAAAASTDPRGYLPYTCSILHHMLRTEATVAIERSSSSGDSADGGNAPAETACASPAPYSIAVLTPAPVPSPLHLRLSCAVLFVDVSGFTRLTESLAQSGRGGLEELSGVLSELFSDYLHTIAEHGGDLIKIAGDALIVCFVHEADLAERAAAAAHDRGSGGNAKSANGDVALRREQRLSEVCCRAMSCALRLQERQQPSSEKDAQSSGTPRLQMHIGLCSGELDFVAIGGVSQSWEGAVGQPASASSASYLGPTPTSASGQSATSGTADASRHFSRWEVLCVGDALGELQQVVAQSGPGEVVASRTTLHRCAATADVRFVDVESDEVDGAVPDAPAPSNLSARILSCTTRHINNVPTDGGFSIAPDSTLPRPLARLGSLTSPCASRPPSPTSPEPAMSVASFLMPALLTRLQQVSGRDDERCNTPYSSHFAVVQDGRPRLQLRMSLVAATPSGRAVSASSSPTLASAADVCHNSSHERTVEPSEPLAASVPSPSAAPLSLWLGEYRRVSVLFVSLPNPQQLSGSTEELECAQSPAAPSWLWPFHLLVRLLQSVVYGACGQMRQLLVDDKGCVMIVVFGLAPFAYEDSATRAVVTAMRLLRALQSATNLSPALARQVAIGCTTGRAWCGPVGSQKRREYTVVGDIVNLAARVMSHTATGGRVLCTEEVRVACKDAIVWADGERSVALKGKQHEVRLFQPLHRAQKDLSSPDHSRDTSSALNTPPVTPELALDRLKSRNGSKVQTPEATIAAAVSTALVKDGPEQMPLSAHHQTLHAILTSMVSGVEVAGGAKPVALIVAQAGQGKSHLARELLAQCTARGMTALVANADSMETTTPYFAFKLVVRQILHAQQQRQPNAPRRTAQRLLLDLLPEQDCSYLPLLAEVLHLAPDELLSPQPNFRGSSLGDDVAAQSPAHSIDAASRAAVIRRLLKQLIVQHCTQHANNGTLCVLFVEDGHWLDMSSWLLVQELAEAEATVPIVLTTRPIAAGDSTTATAFDCCSAVSRLLRCLRVDLAGMDKAQVAALVAATLGTEPALLDDGLLGVIHSKTDGIPLYVQHLCSHFQQRGLLRTHPISGVTSFVRRKSLDALNELPDSLESLLASVLDRLEPSVQLTLRVASVVGRHFPVSLLCAAHPQPSLTLLDIVQMMADAQRTNVVSDCSDADGQSSTSNSGGGVEATAELRVGRRAGETSYRFTHQMLRDAAYNALLYQQRRDLHGKVAQALLRIHLENRGGYEQIDGSEDSDHLSAEAFSSSAASVHHIASHFWLAFTTANGALVPSVDQELLLAAVDVSMQCVSASLALDAIDAAGVQFVRTARLVGGMTDPALRRIWELRLQLHILSTPLMLNGAIMDSMICAYDYGHIYAAGSDKAAQLQQLPFIQRLPLYMQAVADRAEFLLAEPKCVAGLADSQVFHARFSAVSLRFVSCWVSLDYPLMKSSAAQLERMALHELDSQHDHDVYVTEAYHATVPCAILVQDRQAVRVTHAGLSRHAHYWQLLGGHCSANRFGYPCGHSPLSCLSSYLSEYEWTQCHTASAHHILALTPAALQQTHHVASVVHGAVRMLQSFVAFGYHSTCVRGLEWVVDALRNGREHTATHVYALSRRLAQIALRCWKLRPQWYALAEKQREEEQTEQAEEPLSAQEEEAVHSLVGDVHALLDDLETTPAALSAPGMCGPLVLAFPRLLDLPLRFEWPLGVLERMLSFLSSPATPLGKNAVLFHVLHWQTQRSIRQAATCLQHAEEAASVQGADDGEAQRQQWLGEAEAHLAEADANIALGDGPMLALLAQLQWARVRELRGDVRAAVAGLQDALSVAEAADEVAGLSSHHGSDKCARACSPQLVWARRRLRQLMQRCDASQAGQSPVFVPDGCAQ